MARRLVASAVTVGNDIYFRSGSYAPHTSGGLELIGHELVHVMQQAAAARRLDRKVATKDELEEMSPPSTGPLSGLSGSDPELEKFAALMHDRYGTGSVRRGTFSEQAAEVDDKSAALNLGAGRGKLDQARWKEWSPPSGWATYRNILQGVAAFAAGFGGLPKIDEVVFYDAYYDVDANGQVVTANVGADYGAGILRIFSTAVKADPRPAGRSGVPYAGRQAALVPTTSEQAAVGRTIAHELGHGVLEAAIGAAKQGPDPEIINEYCLVAGWRQYRPATPTSPAVKPRLFDAGVQQVRDALNDDKDPPEAYHIKTDHWNDGSWIEQPITKYSTTDPTEDFAESIMAYLKFPDVLKARSPRRFEFIAAGKAKWLHAPEAAPAAPQDRDSSGTISTPGTINTPSPAPTSSMTAEEFHRRAIE
jgi:hypothetical protein